MINLTAVVKALSERRDELQEELSKVDLALGALGTNGQPSAREKKTRRTMSAATRLKIGRATRKRWRLKRMTEKEK